MLNGSKVNDTIYFDNVGYHITDNAFRDNLDLINIVSLASTTGNKCFTNCLFLTNPNFSSLTTVGNGCFTGCSSLTNPNFDNIIILSTGSFQNCTSLQNFDFSNVDNFGDDATDNLVFDGITNKTITVTAKAVHQTSNGGNLDGDLQYLADNNTVTFVWV